MRRTAAARDTKQAAPRKDGMRIALIGANGQLGSELRHTLAGELVSLQRPGCDVCEPNSLRESLGAARPDWVVNCAAWTDVDGCEREPETAYRVNAAGAAHVARIASELRARVLYISTDYVFGGEISRREPCAESDPAMPVNQYGTSKLAGEYATLAAAPGSLIVRSASLYGRAGARGKGGNFVETMLRLAREGKPIRVVADQWMSPTSALECARRCALLISRGASGVVHAAPPDWCTWHAFASAIFELSGEEVEVEPIGSRNLTRAARRPVLSALACRRAAEFGLKPSPPWREQLREYLAARTGSVAGAA